MNTSVSKINRISIPTLRYMRPAIALAKAVPGFILKMFCSVLVLTFLFIQSADAQLYMHGETLFSNEVVGIYNSNVKIVNASLLSTDRFVISNNTPQSVIVDIASAGSNYLGSGVIELTGNGEFDISFDEIMRTGTLDLNNGNNDANFTNAGMVLDSTMILDGAKVVLEDPESYILLKNADINAIAFNPNNSQAFVAGRLVREMAGNAAYPFPVGDLNNMYLLDVALSETDQNTIGVSFDNQLVDNWLAAHINNSSIQLHEEGGWQLDNIEGINSDLNLTAYKASFYDIGDDDEIKFAYFNPIDFPNAFPVITPDQFTVNTTDAVTAKFQSSTGYYALATDDGFNTNKIPNFIVGLDGNNYLFTIPGIDELTNSELAVFDRWGQEVYTESPYRNNLDTRDLEKGTYYYVLTYTKDNISQSFQSFFEVYK